MKKTTKSPAQSPAVPAVVVPEGFTPVTLFLAATNVGGSTANGNARVANVSGAAYALVDGKIVAVKIAGNATVLPALSGDSLAAAKAKAKANAPAPTAPAVDAAQAERPTLPPASPRSWLPPFFRR